MANTHNPAKASNNFSAKLILHIGMGKTGSSSIQKALSDNAEKLRAQSAAYLGMWFDMIDPTFRGVINQHRFFSQPEANRRQMARQFLRALQELVRADGIKTFILSNEAFSGNCSALRPFIDELRDAIEIQAIGYARGPRSWLPSAYVQWGIRDKVNEGRVLPYDEKARELVRWYNGLIEWSEQLGDILEVRHYDAAEDIVCDFAQAVGLDLEAPVTRVLERGEDAEILLRAQFNNRFKQNVLPQIFNRTVLGRSGGFPTVEAAVDRYFDYSSTEQVIAEQMPLFKRFRECFDIDLLSGGAEHLPSRPDAGALRERLLDFLREITLDQARRIDALEREIAILKKSIPRSDC